MGSYAIRALRCAANPWVGALAQVTSATPSRSTLVLLINRAIHTGTKCAHLVLEVRPMKTLLRRVLFTGIFIVAAHSLMALPPQEDDSWTEGANTAYRPEGQPMDVATLKQSAATGDADGRTISASSMPAAKAFPRTLPRPPAGTERRPIKTTRTRRTI
jgi:hypothetical protein